MNDFGHETERRLHERRALYGPAELVPEGARPIQAHMLDVSVGGMRIVAPINPRAGALFLLRTRLPSRPSGSLGVEVKVRVAHSILTGHEDGFVIGLTFLDLPEAAERAIREYVHPAMADA